MKILSLITKYPLRSWKRFSGLTLSQIFTVSIGLINSIIWARYIPKETYGQYQLIISFISISNAFTLTGLNQSISISAAKNLDGNFLDIIKLKIISSFPAACVLIGISFYYSSKNSEIANAILFMALLFPLFQLEGIRQPWFNGKSWFRLLILSNIIFSTFTLITLICPILLNKITLFYLLLCRKGGAVLISLVFLALIIFWRKNYSKDVNIVKFGIHMSVATLFTFLVNTDKFFIHEYLSAADVAVYSIALIFPGQLKSLFLIFNQLFLPKIRAASDLKEAWLYIKPKLLPLNALFILLGISGFYLLPILIPLLFSEKYIPSIEYTKWLWLNYCLTNAAAFLSSILVAQQEINYVYFYNVSSPLTTFIFYFFLISKYGVSGVIISKILVQWIFFFIVFIYFFTVLKRLDMKKL